LVAGLRTQLGQREERGKGKEKGFEILKRE
jgi:hypothetical protein